MTLKYFGEGWGPQAKETIPTPTGWTCYQCGKRIIEGALGVLMTVVKMNDDEDAAIAFHRQCLLESLGIESRDRARLRKAKAVLADPKALHYDLLEAFGSLQSTDDPDPEFQEVHDALQARWRAAGGLDKT